MGVVFRQAWSKSQWTVLMGLPQQMLDAIKHITDDNFFFFQEDSTQVHCAYNTIQLSEIWFSCFRVLPGSAEAQVIWGGVVKCVLIAYFISNISSKKYQNPFMCVKVIANQRWDVFRHGVLCGRLQCERMAVESLNFFTLCLLPKRKSNITVETAAYYKENKYRKRVIIFAYSNEVKYGTVTVRLLREIGVLVF